MALGIPMALLYSSLIAGGAGMGASAMAGGEDGEAMGYNLPDYNLDPYYGSSQKQLSDFGTNLLKGTPNDYYKPIGEVGGQMFEDMLAKGKRDIGTQVTEDFARRNVRGARASNVIAKQVGDYSTQARYQDLMRALEGRKYMMGQGLSTMSGVRSGALNQTSMRNQYEVNKGNLALGYAGLDFKKGQAESGAWSDLVSGTIGGAADMYKSYQMGKVNQTAYPYANPQQAYDVGYGQGNYPGGDYYKMAKQYNYQ